MRTAFTLTLIIALATGLYSQPTLSFQFSNATITGSPPNTKLRFDVNLLATVSGTFHSNGVVYLNYNTNAFGSSINTNNKVTVEKLSLLLGDLAGSDKYSITKNDNTTNIFVVTWTSAFPGGGPSSVFLNEVTTSYLPLLRITIDIADPNELAGISFNPSLMNGQQFYRTAPNADAIYANPNLYANDLFSQPLPIDLKKFKALTTPYSIPLLWETANETNFSGFEVQRSQDGKKFTNLAWVPGKGGQAGASYQYEDKDVHPGITYYYRLKIVDNDGSFEYSPVVSARLEGQNSAAKLYPNPSAGQVTMEWYASADEPLSVDVFSETGRLILSREFQALEGHNQLQLDLQDIPPGLYLLRATSPRETFSGKILLSQ